jgi:hypothetical protein
LLGLSSDYEMDGAAISQVIDRSKLPSTVRDGGNKYRDLMAAYEQLNAPVGEFGHDSEIVSTTASESVSPGDSVFQGFNEQLQACQVARDTIASQMKSILNDAAFGAQRIDPHQADDLIDRANELIGDMAQLSQRSTPPPFTVCG